MTSSAAQNEQNETVESGARAEPVRQAAPSLGRVGSYDLLVEIASGGMATVFLARAPDGRLAAVKRPHPHLAKDPIYTSMLLDEARLASAIDHPNVARVRELGFEVELPFIVMDYVEGSSLVELRRELADAGRALDVRVAARIVLDALGGLRAAHALCDNTGRPLGIIHRDVSPHNVLVGSDGVARLTDFGIAKAEDRVQITRTHEVKGKLSYMAPERVDKRRLCTVQSDVFSMAVVLWEVLAGRRLFKGEEPAHVLDAVLHAPIPLLRKVGAVHVPDAVEQVIARALSRDLSTRYADASEFAIALERACGAELGTHEDVARVIETVFSPRMRMLQESVRHVIGDEATEQLFLASALRVRPRPSPSMPMSTPEIFGAIGTEVPSNRYIIGELTEVSSPSARRGPIIAIAIAVGAVLLVGVGVAIAAWTSSRSSSTSAAPIAPATVAADPAAADRDRAAQAVELSNGNAPAITQSASASANASAMPAGPTPRARPSKPSVGTRRDGFTKLK